MNLHYRFPPASAYRLNRCLHALKSDDAFRDSYLANPDGAAESMGLSPEETAVLRAGDRDALVARGAHPYLVFMAELRLILARGTAEIEYF